jgi:molybdopterin converting factor small subunit
MSTLKIPTVEVLLFAHAAELAGTRRLTIEATTVADAVDVMVQQYPALASVAKISQCWVNQQPASASDELGAGDEIAVIPPVSGG